MAKAPTSPISEQRFQLQPELIAAGPDKIISRAYDKHTGLEVAWHQLFISNLSESQLKQTMALIESLKSKAFPNLLSIIDYWIDKSRILNVITESMSNSSIGERVGHGVLSVKLNSLSHWFLPLLETLDSLHTHNPPIIHRHISLSSIFIKASSGNIKISPPKMLFPQYSNSISLKANTPPECLSGSETTASDIWSFGITLLGCLTNSEPYAECKSPLELANTLLSYVPPKSLASVSCPELKDLISLCLREPSKRPTARELMGHPFFSLKFDSPQPMPSKESGIEVLFVAKKEASLKGKFSSPQLPGLSSEANIPLMRSGGVSMSTPFIRSTSEQSGLSSLASLLRGEE